MAAALTAVGAIVACSGSAGTGTSGGQYDSCLQSLLGSSCISCLQSHCGGAVSGFETGCGDFLGCICPGGNFSAPNAQSPTCSSKLQESSCVSTLQVDGGATACGACQSACSLGGSSSNSGGNGLGNTGSSGGGSSSNCGSILPGTMAVTLSLTGVDLGDAMGPDDWKSIGYNLDGKCTTMSSTDTCGLASGTSRSTQVDGDYGIDNSYGENLCPIFDTLAGGYPCSSGIKQAYLQTDASGTGTLVLGSMVYPVRDVHIDVGGSGGMAGGVIPTAGLTAAWKNAAGCFDKVLCNQSALQAFQTQLAQASDIGADGSNTASTACDGVSFGIKFTGSTPVTSVPSPPNCSCP
jgi:hypothetical protein